MNVQLPVHMDKAAFLDWVERREGRYELAGGRVVMMVGGTRAHGMIVRNLMALIGGQLDSRQWTLLADFGLDAGPKTLRYPDIVVDQAGGAIHDRVATAPALLVEVLSPSTETVDLGDKAAEYLRLPSLVSYVVFAQNEHKAWIWSRHDQASSGPRTIAGVDKIIHIAELRLQLPWRLSILRSMRTGGASIPLRPRSPVPKAMVAELPKKQTPGPAMPPGGGMDLIRRIGLTRQGRGARVTQAAAVPDAEPKEGAWKRQRPRI